MESSVEIRQFREGDLDNILEIERETFPEPFSKGLFKSFMANPAFNNLVAVAGGRVIGYIMYSLVADETDLVNIAVEASMRHKGIGKKMMTFMFDDLKKRGGLRVYLDVRPSNTVAINFYEEFGFVKIGVRPNYYQKSGEDALVYSRDLRW